jgi:hypothetical protein
MELDREKIIPFLFSLFLNDLETFLEAKNVTGLESISGDLENQLKIYLKLFIILYADDTVILSESESDLQAQLDAFHEYCLTCILSKRLNRHFIDKLCFLPNFIETTALSTKRFFARLKLPLLLKIIPRQLKFLTTSISEPGIWKQ